MKKYIVPALLVIIAFGAGFYAAGGFGKKLNYQQVAFAMVDANAHCWVSKKDPNDKDRDQYDCSGYPKLLMDVLARDPKKEETISRITGYLSRPDNTIPAEAKKSILAVLNK